MHDGSARPDGHGTTDHRAAPPAGRLVAVAGAVVLLAGLRVAEAVMVPLAFAIFLAAVFWPLQRRLAQRLPAGVAALLTLLAVLAVLALLVGAFSLAIDTVIDNGRPYFAQIEQLLRDVRAWLEAQGIPVAGGDDGGGEHLRTGALGAVQTSVEVVSSFVLILALFVLGLLEVMDYHAKLTAIAGPRADRWLAAVRRVTDDFQRYIVVRTLVGLITGVATGLVCLLAGLEFAFVWGLINFLLNYIPTIGSIIGVIPPVLFALVQFEGAGHALVVLAGVGGVQLLMGNWIDPLLQGRFLRLSPFVVLLSVVFWGWLWGIAGAFLSMPITVAVVIAARQSERTRWLSTLLADHEDDTAANPTS
jgi:predicted PurR-regulated permease PerM